MRSIAVLLIAASTAIAGCDSPPSPETSTAAADATQAPNGPAEVADDESESEEPINLTPLNEMQIGSAALQGELGCSFARAGETHPLLVAKADVVPNGDILGVVALSGRPERIANVNAGGFSDMDPGVTLSSDTLTVEVETTGKDESELENSVRKATLTANRADGASRSYDGKWTCGP